ncbi:hypothetical protein LWI28_018868 [Acer negundo]|uniref:Uncharacterized protein n=1 Tax=Acer negundo TaxID=4023 RepID=A0AAD5P137_ACENE|nr:hypothetical protein LWI28_018868 [Acer negundo]KAK4856460.1 hypothetical protein QYF36_017765 [Acer negundo]
MKTRAKISIPGKNQLHLKICVVGKEPLTSCTDELGVVGDLTEFPGRKLDVGGEFLAGCSGELIDGGEFLAGCAGELIEGSCALSESEGFEISGLVVLPPSGFEISGPVMLRRGGKEGGAVASIVHKYII